MRFEKLKNHPKLPQHIAIIIDGNGRWALKHGMKRSAGHKIGSENIRKHMHLIQELGIKNLSIYAFSQQNWNRPDEEVAFLLKTFDRMLNEFEADYLDKEVRLMISGNLDDERISDDVRNKAKHLMDITKHKTGFVVNVCINYGGREEILQAVNNIVNDKISNVDEKTFENYLYTSDLLPLDFVIRTSGEQRTSNFMPWQTTYSEWYFPKTLWPSFSKKDLVKALKSYMKRNRRFGAIKG